MLIHQPRLAWDGARVLVAASESDVHFVWLSGEVRALLGVAYQRALSETRMRLKAAEHAAAAHAEAGTWRVRLEDLLRRHPELTGPLQELVAAATARMPRRAPQWPQWPIN
jgi:hypothetical protein